MLGSRLLKTFPLVLDDSLHKKIKIASATHDMTIHQWILSAIQSKLDFESVSEKDHVKAENK